MPRIPDQLIDCSIYLYKDENSAKEGKGSGGSGFLVHIPSAVTGYVHLYAITNKHVLIEGGCGTLRLNRKVDGFDVIPTKLSDWTCHKDGDDVAACPIDLGETFKWWSVGANMFLAHEIVDVYRIGLGDEAFLIGRLITHDGIQKNTPIVRFGNISLMADPSELIRTKNGDREGFLVECRSLSGFSGSPVFITTTQGYRNEDAERLEKHEQKARGYVEDKSSRVKVKVSASYGTFGPWLLGIDWGHIPLWNPVFESDRVTKRGQMVEANTGIACVAPTWKILDVLNEGELVKKRKQEDEVLARQSANEQVAVNDVAREESSPPFTQQNFQEALRKASRRVSSSKSEPEKKRG
jgi:hypothetical protein